MESANYGDKDTGTPGLSCFYSLGHQRLPVTKTTQLLKHRNRKREVKTFHSNKIKTTGAACGEAVE